MFTIYDNDNDRFTVVEEPDPAVSYTYADYLQWKFEERLELFHGRITKQSAPNTKHQLVAGNIFAVIKAFLSRQQCQVFIAPFDVRLPEKNRMEDDEITTVVQPDIAIICDESKIDAKGCCGAPDVIMEILSPGNTHKEIKIKFELYQEFGIKEYWIVFPEEESVAVFRLNEEGKYNGATLYASKDSIKSTVVPGLVINSRDVFIKNSL